jgi:RNA polymerase sigma factor (sigma-70 family)
LETGQTFSAISCKLPASFFDNRSVADPPKKLTAGSLGNDLAKLARLALRTAHACLPRPDEFQDAEDAASEAMLALTEKVEAGEEVADPAGFVVRVAQRRATDRIRGKSSWRSLLERGVLAASEGTDPGEAEMGEVEQRFQDALERMPIRQRLCFVRFYVGNMSEKEIAMTLGIKPGTVKSHLSRARDALWRELH